MGSHVELAAGAFRLRPPEVADAPEVLRLAADPDVRLWNPRCRIPDEAAALADCLRGADWSDGTHATFSLVETGTGRYAGTIALHGLDRENAQARIGYRIAPWARGRGAATASVRAVTGWAVTVLELERIVLTHAVENQASCRVAGKAGFALEGVMRSARRFGDGLLHDEHLHALLATDLRS
ncbi:GNAT family N-acetyltransferase [Nonomuraea sp. NN258]|uniref:GNAT family N-acetyltransferase n=1 Tax=Nonomuraea antri TaxID=2730852 RepID=UPI001567D5F0|nr:GNAT family protein [Nonomuraea antri]NRQ40566.1 GNAT family N-acetyltransferase [Nonomuraea antri]